MGTHTNYIIGALEGENTYVSKIKNYHNNDQLFITLFVKQQKAYNIYNII